MKRTLWHGGKPKGLRGKNAFTKVSWKGRPKQKESQGEWELWKPTKETVSGRKWSTL